jgi:dephospho-CoA kinase
MNNTTQPLIIAISGKLGTGKDYVGKLFYDYLRANGYNPLFMSFADHLKVEAMSRHGLSFDEVTDHKTENSRQILQHMGTEEYKAKYGDDVWVKYFCNWVQFHSKRGINAFIVCDLRFTVEYDYLMKNNAFIVRLYAPDRNMNRVMQEVNNDVSKVAKIINHASETDLDQVKFDHIIDNRMTNAAFVDEFKMIINTLNHHIEYINALFLESCD